MRHPEVWWRVGLNITFLRKQKMLTQADLAERCRGQSDDTHISRNYLQRIETGNTSCTLDTLVDIADALDVPLIRLLETNE